MVEKTFALIKSGALSRGSAPAILSRILEAGFSIGSVLAGQVCARESDGSFPLFAKLYEEHAGRVYYDGLIESVTSPIQAMAFIIEGDNAIQAWRDMMGATNPAQAAPGTIRSDFGRGLPDNATHGSDSPASAEREIRLFFGDVQADRGVSSRLSTEMLMEIASQLGNNQKTVSKIAA